MKKILLIEDEAAVLDNILEILEISDFEVIGAYNGKEGVDMAKKYLPDLIVCDIMMPEMDGFQVLDELQKTPATSTIPFIFLTARVKSEDLRRGMELGADDYLTKPFTSAQLRRAIIARLKKKTVAETKSEEQIDEIRKNLSMMLPHEFRTPLNGILASSQFLIDYSNEIEPDEVKQLHETIFSSAKRLHRLILNYLFYADIELLLKDQKHLEDIHDFSTHSSLDIVDMIIKRAAENNKRAGDLKIDLKDCPIRIMQEHFMKICEELADNAFKFSNKGSNVIVKSEIKDDMYILTITDYGRGMSPEQIMKIGAYIQFERKVYEQQGSGLGLAIAQRLTELYGGNLRLESENGSYTTVIVSLPILQVS